MISDKNTLERGLQELFKYAFATNCHLDNDQVSVEETETIDTFDSIDLLENFKDLILNLLSFKKESQAQTKTELLHGTATKTAEITFYKPKNRLTFLNLHNPIQSCFCKCGRTKRGRLHRNRKTCKKQSPKTNTTNAKHSLQTCFCRDRQLPPVV